MPDQNTQLASEFKGQPEAAVIYAALRIEDAITESTRVLRLAIESLKEKLER
jgi:hypothetical protein